MALTRPNGIPASATSATAVARDASGTHAIGRPRRFVGGIRHDQHMPKSRKRRPTHRGPTPPRTTRYPTQPPSPWIQTFLEPVQTVGLAEQADGPVPDHQWHRLPRLPQQLGPGPGRLRNRVRGQRHHGHQTHRRLSGVPTPCCRGHRTEPPHPGQQWDAHLRARARRLTIAAEQLVQPIDARRRPVLEQAARTASR
jgi:hypothetical protein